MKSVLKLLFVVTAAWLALAPSPVFACAACYGKSDSPLASGMNAGIFTLLGVILSVLTCFALFFVHVMRSDQSQLNDSTAPAPDSTSKTPTDV